VILAQPRRNAQHCFLRLYIPIRLRRSVILAQPHRNAQHCFLRLYIPSRLRRSVTCGILLDVPV